MQDDETEPGELPVSTSPFKQALGVSIALLAAYVPASDGRGLIQWAGNMSRAAIRLHFCREPLFLFLVF